MTILYALDLLGTFAFAVSGAIAAARKDMDIYGMFVLAVVTAVGGGTMRDVLIGRIPPFVFNDFAYLGISLLAVLLVFFSLKRVERTAPILVVMDAIGLGVFTVIGVSVAMEYGMSWYGSILMGVMTGTAGGMVRDVLRGEVPFVLSREVYASACIAGGAIYWALEMAGLNHTVNTVVAAVLVTGLRLLSLARGWQLPKPIKKGGHA